MIVYGRMDVSEYGSLSVSEQHIHRQNEHHWSGLLSMVTI